jgi:aspartate racemase
VKKELLRVARNLSANGAEAIVLGCTEFPLILEEGDLQIPIIDATEVLAQSAVNRAKE